MAISLVVEHVRVRACVCASAALSRDSSTHTETACDARVVVATRTSSFVAPSSSPTQRPGFSFGLRFFLWFGITASDFLYFAFALAHVPPFHSPFASHGFEEEPPSALRRCQRLFTCFVCVRACVRVRVSKWGVVSGETNGCDAVDAGSDGSQELCRENRSLLGRENLLPQF